MYEIPKVYYFSELWTTMREWLEGDNVLLYMLRGIFLLK